MRFPYVVGTAIAALMVSACAGSQKHAQRAAEQAEADAREARKEAREARDESAKAQRQLREARREQAKAEQDARWADQRAAQAQMQAAREAHMQPRTGATETQPGDAPHVVTSKYTVLFPADSTELTADAKPKLDDAVKALRDRPSSTRVVVDGYADATGDETHNTDLSQRRADAVAQYLESKGVAGDRITTKGFGSRNRAGNEPTAEQRASDRRVDVVIR